MLKSVHSFKIQRLFKFNSLRLFSSEQQSSQSLSDKELMDLHKVQHSKFLIDSKFHKDDIEPTFIKEIEFIRSPFYDLGKSFSMNDSEAEQFLANIEIKGSIRMPEGIVEKATPTKEEEAYTRYADN